MNQSALSTRTPIRIRNENELRYAINNATIINGRAQLQGANLEGSYFNGGILRNLDLQGANLREIYIPYGRFENVNLEGSNLENAYLKDVEFINTDLSGANLRGSFLLSASIQNTNIIVANLEGAYVRDIPEIDQSNYPRNYFADQRPSYMNQVKIQAEKNNLQEIQEHYYKPRTKFVSRMFKPLDKEDKEEYIDKKTRGILQEVSPNIAEYLDIKDTKNIYKALKKPKGGNKKTNRKKKSKYTKRINKTRQNKK